MVALAAVRLYDLLLSWGADVKLVAPPLLPNAGDQGIDDCIASGGDLQAVLEGRDLFEQALTLVVKRGWHDSLGIAASQVEFRQDLKRCPRRAESGTERRHAGRQGCVLGCAS